MSFLFLLIRLIIFFGILYLIFANFGTFLMLIGWLLFIIVILIYYIKNQLLKKAKQYEFRFDSSSFSNQGFNFNEFRNFDFNSFNNNNFQGFYAQNSKVEEAKNFFGFSQNPNKEEIKKRYKKLAKKYHPDLNGGNDEKMKKLNEYRDILMQAYSN